MGTDMNTCFKNKITVTVLLLAFIVAGYACSDNPVDDVTSHERAIIDFRVDNQVGVPDITRTVNEAELTVYVQSGTDLSNLAPEIMVSYGANVTPESGEPVDFEANDGQYTYTVTSESGRTREWLVRVEFFESNLSGTWEVTGVYFNYRFGEDDDWAWGEEARPLEWDLESAENAIGNRFHFNVEGTDEQGRNYGQFIQEPGPEGDDYIDFGEWAYKFDLVPRGEGTYHRDFSNDSIIFEEGSEDESRTATMEFSGDEQSLRIPFEVEQDIDWDVLDNLGAADRFWYELEKIE